MTRLLQSSNSLKRMQTEKARMAGFCIGIDRVRILRSIRVACFVLLMLACVDFCVPNDVNLKTLQDQVYSYVFRHQKQHNVFTAAPAVALAFYNFYPCKK